MNEINTSVTSSIISGMLLDNQNYTNTMTNASNEISETYINSTEENGNIQLWNVSKAVTSLPNNTVISFEASSTNIYVSTTTEIFDEFGPPDGIEYIFVPLGVVVFVIILSAVVWVAISLLYLNYNLLLTSIYRNKKNKIKNIHQIIILG